MTPTVVLPDLVDSMLPKIGWRGREQAIVRGRFFFHFLFSVYINSQIKLWAKLGDLTQPRRSAVVVPSLRGRKEITRHPTSSYENNLRFEGNDGCRLPGPRARFDDSTLASKTAAARVNRALRSLICCFPRSLDRFCSSPRYSVASSQGCQPIRITVYDTTKPKRY